MTGAWNQWEGRVINGAFELKKYLGGSEFSAVFLTEDREHPPHPAAIKLIAANPADAELQLARWALAQGLPHPHLIRILQTGRSQFDADQPHTLPGTGPENELIFLVMEYAQENLAEIISQRPLTAQEAREMLEPALDALAWLHTQGFVNGHLKPANVLAVNDELKLASEGIGRAGETVSGPGTPVVYDAPEMAGGVRSPAADVWSLGMVLAEALTQRLPAWNQNDQADPVLPENLPAPFRDIVRGCLRRDPQRRLAVVEIAARLHDGPPPQPARVADANPVPQRPAVGAETTGAQKPRAHTYNRPISEREAVVRRFAFPVWIALAALLVLLAGFLVFGRHAETKPAAIKPEQQPKPYKPDPRYLPGKTSAKTLSPKTSLKTPANTVSPNTASPDKKTSGLPPASAPAPAPPIKPATASLPSETQAPARGLGPTGGTNSGPADSAVIRRVLPEIPQSARDTITGTLRINVRVNVDPSGSVVGAEFDSPPRSQYIARMALQAAQSWKFAPRNPDTSPGAGREFVVHFEFTTLATKAFATRTAP